MAAISGTHKVVYELFEAAHIVPNGSNPWDPQILDRRFYDRIHSRGSLGLGEAYMDGDWCCAALDQFFDRVIAARLGDKLGFTVPLALLVLKSRILNRQNLHRARQAAEVHYDLPVDVFEATFDTRLTGSCGYWKGAATLDDAQDAKLDLICRKIGLHRNQRVLDIGCGWGSFMGFASERYGAQCSGITISKMQMDYARKRYAHLPVEPLLEDYRNYSGPRADHVVSMGMFEHVGSKNHRIYFERARSFIKDSGIFLLHTIWENKRYPTIDPWQNKYIFPNGDLPSVGQIASAVEGLFVVEDLHNFGADYDKTLMAWNAKFQTNRAEIVRRHGERFCRMWEYYLLQSAGAFRCRHINVGQFVLSPFGVRGGYDSVR
ncbi:MAG TPA: cyclopropane fatty acyl phospholipid synthase [Rhizomicrobium sp.]|nr:cyclopropane fatty acyl phospholipid synthase [Rhizomicrobium sp.]